MSRVEVAISIETRVRLAGRSSECIANYLDGPEHELAGCNTSCHFGRRLQTGYCGWFFSELALPAMSSSRFG